MLGVGCASLFVVCCYLLLVVDCLCIVVCYSLLCFIVCCSSVVGRCWLFVVCCLLFACRYFIKKQVFFVVCVCSSLNSLFVRVLYNSSRPVGA